MIEEFLAPFTAIVDAAGLFGLEQALLSLDLWDVLNPEVLRFIENKLFVFAGGITDRLAEDLRVQLREAIRAGEGISPMTKRIQKVFDGLARGSAPRARMIARTETTGIVNGGQALAWQQNPDVVEGKEWLSSRDNRVRPSHTAADGQEVTLDNAFNVGGALLRFPGDPQGPAKEVINCRCTILPTLL